MKINLRKLLNAIVLATALYAPSATALPTEGLTDLSGGAPKLFEKATTELVIFWATWCPDCKQKLTSEIPALEPELRKTPELSIVTVNTEKEVERVKHYVEKEGLKHPVLLDPEKKLRKALGVFSVPAWAVYKRKAVTDSWTLVDTAPAFEIARVNKALGRELFR